jgi:uncharacterized membrane protein YhaH (DUF805 family)
MIIQCHECGTQVSTEARACVQCGAPPQLAHGPTQTIQQEEGFVSFEAAKYAVACPTCGGSFLVTGKSLALKPFLKCPHTHVAGQSQKIPIGKVKPRLAEDQVIYRRLNDYYSCAGRLSVADYWLSALLALPFLLIAKVVTGPLYPVLVFIILYPLWVKRLQDQGMHSEWVAIQGVAAVASSIAALLLPKVLAGGESHPIFAIIYGLILLVSLGFGITISFVPGENRINRYGPPKFEVKRVWW